MPHQSHSRRFFMAIGLAAGLVAACVPAPTGTPAAGGTGFTVSADQAVKLRFKGMVGSEPLITSAPASAVPGAKVYAGVGKDAQTVRPVDFRFYVHDLKLLKSDGSTADASLTANTWQYQTLALVDLDAGTTPDQNDTVTFSAPAGTYTGVRFTLGVPAALNHTDVTAAAAPHPILVSESHGTGMAWAWLSGRKYAKVEFNVPKADGTEKKFYFHLGGTGASNPTKQEGSYIGFDPVKTVFASPNLPTVTMAGFNPLTQTVVADLKGFLANVAIADGGTYMPAPATASAGNDPQVLLKNLGLAGGGTQTFFQPGR